MAIDFNQDQWKKVKQTYACFWAGSLARPVLSGRDPGRAKPAVPLLSQATCHDLSIAPGALIDRLDYELSTFTFLGDSFPYINLDCFGPGIAAAFMGASLDNSGGNVWFFPPEKKPVEEIHLSYNADNVWLRRVKAIGEAAMQRWQGMVLVSMPDLGGILDILATFCQAENLLAGFYTAPLEIKRLISEAHALWHRFFDEINQVLQPANPGYSDWSSVYSDCPAYILQCDVAYMIGPEMFDEFVLPELESFLPS